MGPRAGLDRCGKSRPTGILSPDLPTRSQSLYRLSYRTHMFPSALIKNLLRYEIPSCRQLLRRLANSRFCVVSIGVTEFLPAHGYAADGERLSHS